MRASIFHSRLTKAVGFWLRQLVGLGVWVLAIQGRAADVSTPSYGPPSSWVKPQFFNQQPATILLEAGNDQRVLLRDQQVNALQNETFIHTVRQILTLDGVQKGATLTMDFNPGYETLTVHWARLWRAGQHLDRLDTNQVKVVQQEQDLDQFLLNGQKSAVLVLDDVRVGDIIDYAYSIKGENPVFGDHFYTAVPVQLEQPADRLLTRVLWPAQKRLYAKPHGCSVVATAAAGKTSVEYIWDLRQMPGLTLEDVLPDWYDPEPWVQLSDFKSWTEVNQWALGLFKVTAPLSGELAKNIAAWKQIPDPEQQILAVLRFVQDYVRYFGIEIGASAEKPADPSMVFARRFGDCKDKSLLFVTILRALGIEAYPVLVNATLGRGVGEWQPSAGAFDHCIAMAQCAGQVYWLDPTMNYQRGPLESHYLPDYGYGLVISPYTTELSAIPHTTGWPQTTTTEYFQIRGKDTPSELKVVTVAEGRDAEDLRALFATTKRSEIERSYTHFYSDLYPGIRMSSPVVMEDDEQQNRVQTTEFYSINQMWTNPDNDKKYRCDFYPSVIAAWLKKPVDTERKLPLGIHYPEHQIVHTEVSIPWSWEVKAERKIISDPAFTFRKDCRRVGNKLVMDYEYWAQADSVSPDQMDQYLDRLNASNQALGFALTWH